MERVCELANITVNKVVTAGGGYVDGDDGDNDAGDDGDNDDGDNGDGDDGSSDNVGCDDEGVM